MLTSAESVVGYEIVQAFGPVEGIVEKSYTAVSVRGIGAIQGGDLPDLVFNAKQLLAREAVNLGANAVIAFRYAISGRELEKSVVAYGTAVKCQKRA